ncbi:MAG: hypothetical protein FWC03_11770 [Treponema sp.]|nr:hypothetical protein [Treponema sp.]MCL2245122.1 hypothetical protein [Treponema sp.]
MSSVKNKTPVLEDVQPVIDEKIVETVNEIFQEVVNLNALKDCFSDLAARIIEDLRANDFMDQKLELNDDQKNRLRGIIQQKGNETVQNYLANINSDSRTKSVYGIVKKKTASIADTVLSSIGAEINRGAIINAEAVQANSKNPKYDEILLRKTKTSGDITVPTSCILISTNCVELIKSACHEDTAAEDDESETDGEEKAKTKRGKK